MAKSKEKSPSLSSYFRDVFEGDLSLLDGSSNAAIQEKWQHDHPGEEWTKRISQSMANIKSQLRRKFGKVRRRNKRSAAAAVPAGDDMKPMRTRTPSVNTLERLEMLIDESLSLAVSQHDEALEGAIKHLRVARRSVVWAMGEPAAAR
jgi:hypothetical protein